MAVLRLRRKVKRSNIVTLIRMRRCRKVGAPENWIDDALPWHLFERRRRRRGWKIRRRMIGEILQGQQRCRHVLLLLLLVLLLIIPSPFLFEFLV